MILQWHYKLTSEKLPGLKQFFELIKEGISLFSDRTTMRGGGLKTSRATKQKKNLFIKGQWMKKV